MLRVAGSAQAERMDDQPKPKRGNMPSARSAGICSASCKTPPTITPTAMAKIGSMPCAPNHGASHQAAAMVDTLSSTGVAAGTAKRL